MTRIDLFILKYLRQFVMSNFYHILAFVLLLIPCATPAGSPTRIALLLPLHGPYAEVGQAVRDGFLAAYYQSLPQDPTAPTIRIVDTADADIVALYHRAVDQGASLIVGPLNKEQGLQLVNADALSVPTLVLNTLPLTQSVPRYLYQLSLAPEDEARQVADKASRDERRNAALIVPATVWGQRIAQTFLMEWQAVGGKVVGEMYYQDPAQLSAQMAQLLHVDQSEQRAKEMRRLLLQPHLRTIPYRRQDIDMVFLVAKPELARQLKPLLNFYYASNIPVYATSHLYAGTPNPLYDRDLNGVMFCAIPWEIAPQTLPPDIQEILHSVQQTWPQALQKQSPFFALGVDSYRLARQISRNAVATVTPGATGQLILQSNKVWYRQLPWATFIEGQPQ
jgi:uncharacterized protein